MQRISGRRRTFLTIVLCALLAGLLPPKALAATDSWYREQNAWLCFKTKQSGVIQIKRSDLQMAGWSFAMDPRNMRVWNLGRELPLHWWGNADADWEESEYFTFYLPRLTGAVDRDMYWETGITDPQPQNLISIFTDSNTVFLEYDPLNHGLRYQLWNTTDTSGTELPWFWRQADSAFIEVFYPGQDLGAGATYLEWTQGEGWMGNRLTRGSAQNRTIPTPFMVNGPAPELNLRIFGVSNTHNPDLDSNHHVQVLTSPTNGSYVLRAQQKFSDYSAWEPQLVLNGHNPASALWLRLESVPDLNVSTDNTALAQLKLRYPAAWKQELLPWALIFEPDNSFTGDTFLIKAELPANQALVVYFPEQAMALQSQFVNGRHLLKVPAAYKGSPMIWSAPGPSQIPPLRPVVWVPKQQNYSARFVIVHTGELGGAAEEYRLYRNSGMPSTRVSLEQISNSYYYGLEHPLALRTFCDQLVDSNPQRPYILLLGQGYLYPLRPPGTAVPANSALPAFGNPPSDVLYTSGPEYAQLQPQLPIGRVPALNPQEALIYLDKLKEFEAAPDSLWRKNILHYSGGIYEFEQVLWKAYVKEIADLALDSPFGAHNVLRHKTSSSPVSQAYQELFQQSLNRGIEFFNFFGHGATFLTEMDMGEPSELQNKGKYPFFLFNGCNAGNVFVTQSLTRAFTFEPGKGCIGTIGTTDKGFAYELHSISRNFLGRSLNTHTHNSVAQNMADVLGSVPSTTMGLMRTHARQFVFIGDPAIGFYAPPLPDYYVPEHGLTATDPVLFAGNDSLGLQIVVHNRGKYIKDSLEIWVQHLDPNNKILGTYSFKVPGPANRDTVNLRIPLAGEELAGNNRCILRLDPGQLIQELDEANNTRELEIFLPGQGVRLLYPVDGSLLPPDSLKLVFQDLNPIRPNGMYLLEYDSLPGFQSPWAQQKSVGPLPNGLGIISLDLQSAVPKRIYWRVGPDLNDPAQINWSHGSFSVGQTPDTGFYFAQNGQWNNWTTENMSVHPGDGTLEFSPNVFRVSITCIGDDVDPGEIRRELRINQLIAVSADLNFTGLSFLAVHPRSFARFAYPSNYCLKSNTRDYPPSVHEYSGVFRFNTNQSTDLDSMIYYLNRIPPDYRVFVYSGVQFHGAALPAPVQQLFTELGATKLSGLKPGWPYILYGKKGMVDNWVKEYAPDPSAPDSLGRHTTFFTDLDYPAVWANGSLLSPWIGPAQTWRTLLTTPAQDPEDEYSWMLMGRSPTGQVDTLYSGPADSLDLSTIQALSYPFLRTQLIFRDSVDFTPHAPGYLFLRAKPAPVRTLESQNLNFYADTLLQGDSLRWTVRAYSFGGPMEDSARLYLSQGVSKSILQPLDTLSLNSDPGAPYAHARLTYSSLPWTQDRTIKISLPDPWASSARLERSFHVSPDQSPPRVEVQVNGRRILNGELIDPNPLVTLVIRDQNPFLSLGDTQAIVLEHRPPGQSHFTRLQILPQQVEALKAAPPEVKISHAFKELANGSHTLRVQVRDGVGNPAFPEPWSLSFQIDNTPSISHVYPYPNPFSTRAQWVYTLTGSRPPEKLRIDIYSQSGKWVKGIDLHELEPLRIGAQVSTYAWDGRDRFGDPLANGVYMYKVTARLDGAEMELRSMSPGDASYFKKGWGKLYIIR